MQHSFALSKNECVKKTNIKHFPLQVFQKWQKFNEFGLQYFANCVWSFRILPDSSVCFSAGLSPEQDVTNTLQDSISLINLLTVSSKRCCPSLYPSSNSRVVLEPDKTVLSSSDCFSLRESWAVISWNKSPFTVLQLTYTRSSIKPRPMRLELVCLGPSVQEETRM